MYSFPQSWELGERLGGIIASWPPSANRLWRLPTRGPLRGRALLSKEARQYKAEIEMEWRKAGDAPPHKGPIVAQMYAFPPDRRRRDLDNTIKIALDCLKGQAYDDDSQIVALSIERGPALTQTKGVIMVELYAATVPESLVWMDEREQWAK